MKGWPEVPYNFTGKVEFANGTQCWYVDGTYYGTEKDFIVGRDEWLKKHPKEENVSSTGSTEPTCKWNYTSAEMLKTVGKSTNTVVYEDGTVVTTVRNGNEISVTVTHPSSK